MDLLEIGKTEYKLFDTSRMRFVPNVKPVFWSEDELVEANEYFVKSRCPHLQWKSDGEQPARNYAIKI